jgi:hypothetical protein
MVPESFYFSHPYSYLFTRPQGGEFRNPSASPWVAVWFYYQVLILDFRLDEVALSLKPQRENFYDSITTKTKL